MLSIILMGIRETMRITLLNNIVFNIAIRQPLAIGFSSNTVNTK